MLFWINPEGRFLDANEQACHALGYSRQTLQMLAIWDIDPGFPCERWPDHWQELRQAKTLHFQTTHRCRDGSPSPVEVFAHYLELDGHAYNCALAYPLTPQRQTENALRASEERLALALAVSGQGLYDLNIATSQTVFSDEYARMLGYKPSELELTPALWASWLHPEDREEILHLFESCVTGKRRNYRAEFRLRTRSGDWIWVLSMGKVVDWDAAGRPLRMVGTHLNITERKRTEEVLRESEERFAKAFRASPAPMAISIIKTGQFLDVNEQWLKMMGHTREETIGHTSMELGIWADPGIPERMIAQLRADGFFQDAPVRFRTKTGAILEALWSAETVRLGEQGVLLSLVYDITERKRTEEALRTSEAFLEAIIEHSPHSMWVSDDRGVLIRMNQACRDMLHVADEDLVGQYNIFEDNIVEQQGAMPLVKRVFEQGERVWFTIRYDSSQLRPLRLRGVTQVILEVTISPVLDAQKRVIHAIIQHVNITERKRVEEELQRHREHLEELVAERTAALERANAELRQAMTQLVQSEKLAALGSLVAGVAHELNTPLGNARVVASSLGEHLQDFAAAVESGSLRRSQVDAFLSRGREAVDLLERNAARAADLINHFKQVAVDQTSTRRRSFNLRQTVEEVLVTLRPQFKRTAHRIELEIPPDLALDSYPGPLEQVIANLISNSLTHGFEGIAAGVIHIRAAPLGTTHVHIDYTDNGVGIPETIVNRIFDPFFTTKLGSGGSGLGLYIVYNLVTGVLGGTIQAYKPPSHGTTFTLILPCTVPN